jgi:hypothetical protein
MLEAAPKFPPMAPKVSKMDNASPVLAAETVRVVPFLQSAFKEFIDPASWIPGSRGGIGLMRVE